MVQSRQTRWGWFIFLLSPMYIAGVYVLVNRSQHAHSIYGLILPILCGFFSLIAFFTGHFSYPRVHNLKVYIIGYLTGLSGVVYLVFFLFFQKGSHRIAWLHFCIFFNFLLVFMMPSYVKYRTTRRVTLGILLIEGVILIVVNTFPVFRKWGEFFTFSDFYHYAAWGTVLWMLFIFLMSVSFLKYEFHLGGLLCGCALLYLASWLSPLLVARFEDLRHALFAGAPAYLVGGIIVHWISRMEQRASYDPLLQIYNRSYCSRILAEQSNLNTSPPFGVAMIDIDHFKRINDSYGHQVGDRVLFAVAQIVQREAVPEGVVCRYGGEEIAIFFPEKQTKKILPLIERVRVEVARMKLKHGGKTISVTVSCGVSHRKNASQQLSEVVEDADRALYAAKNNGRNQVRASSHGSRKKTNRRRGSPILRQ
jgi:diguanylate cyclase (GGDEF)-like protein